MSKIMPNLATTKISDLKNKILFYKKTLYHINPENNLRKGYSLVYKTTNGQPDIQLSLPLDYKKLVTRAKELIKGEEVEIKFYDDKKSAKIND
jgi:exonuclease VII large subunit